MTSHRQQTPPATVQSSLDITAKRNFTWTQSDGHTKLHARAKLMSHCLPAAIVCFGRIAVTRGYRLVSRASRTVCVAARLSPRPCRSLPTHKPVSVHSARVNHTSTM